MKEAAMIIVFLGMAAGGYLLVGWIGTVFQNHKRENTSEIVYYEDIDEDTKK